MSWSNVIPFWVLCVEHEEHQARMLGAFPGEVDSGFLRSLPEDVAENIRKRQIYWESEEEF